MDTNKKITINDLAPSVKIIIVIEWIRLGLLALALIGAMIIFAID